METNEIIEKAKETVNGIYANISRIESCQTVLNLLDGAEVLISKDGTVSDLHQVLSDYQIADVMATIHGLVKRNINEAAGAIERVCCEKNYGELDKSAVENEPVDVDIDTILAENEAKSETKEPIVTESETVPEAPKSPKASKSTLPPDEEEQLLRKLYVKEQKTVKEIADIMGLTKANIYDRIKKYGLRNAKYDRLMDSYDKERKSRYEY